MKLPPKTLPQDNLFPPYVASIFSTAEVKEAFIIVLVDFTLLCFLLFSTCLVYLLL